MLSSLLDGLHKDLNKLQQETYIEAKYSEGLLINEVAVEAWKNYKDQIDSLIVDAFHGQSSSTMICQDCGKTSFKFDPFKSLLLPLVGFRSIMVTVFDGNGSNLPIPYTVIVAKNGVFNDLSKAISDVCLLNSQERLELSQVDEYKSYFVNPLDLLSTIEDTDYLVGYRFNLVNKGRELFKLEVYHGEEDTFDTNLYLFGTPLVTYI
ncbi:putative ubiquitin carboxyl-terminal hydrolase 11 [Arabidopsis lyrata subsp. lyrata]|uniref:putative ubiquitin carboxyl-terminal hydrolase 11 n=1 Tax=Arabidopsis lyrata subsp. lyrata TaxID=81972 RepID=UPI000A29B09F|nr:putative ubiquitin carboxyl-terminal hydrolase 11 [Arabidopsis lyrata subsp. lyrata]|eukprot:XP_020869434.1 putative ubiquitin carboxyl-terminal hydrolase 11 [Arabidopsis lyrata subsp. lyrata]